MKSTTQIFKAIGIALLAGSATSRAENWRENFYVHADIGPSFTDNATTHLRKLDPAALPPDPPFIGSKGTFKSDVGIRGDIALGYSLTKTLALELESGVIWNDGPDQDQYFYQIPVMVNAVCQIPLNDSWKIYFGAGAGEIFSTTHFVVRDAAYHTPFVFDASDWSFGYQAQVGIKYGFSRHLEADLGYRFLAVDEYNYSFSGFNPFLENMRINDLFTHSAQLSFTWKF